MQKEFLIKEKYVSEWYIEWPGHCEVLWILSDSSEISAETWSAEKGASSGDLCQKKMGECWGETFKEKGMRVGVGDDKWFPKFRYEKRAE